MGKFHTFWFVLCLLFIGHFCDAQEQQCRYYISNEGDTIPIIDMPVCIVGDLTKPPRGLSPKQLKRYSYLEKRVRKVYPYAQLASAELKKREKELAVLTKKRDRRKVMKKVEKVIKDQYGDELKRLSVSSGKILLKLIDRETGKTSYELVKEMRGSFAVGVYQGIARLFGHNLKSQYDATGDDKFIEIIINRIKAGA